MEYKMREQPVIVACRTYEEEKIITRLAARCELSYDFLPYDDEKVKIITNDPSQILYMRRHGLLVEYCNQEDPARFSDDPAYFSDEQLLE